MVDEGDVGVVTADSVIPRSNESKDDIEECERCEKLEKSESEAEDHLRGIKLLFVSLSG